jgi:DNA-binding LacI/PurR family transcriptional regulator
LTSAAERLKGFRHTFNQADIDIEPEFVPEVRSDTTSGYQAVLSLVRMLRDPTVIIGCDDLIALGVLQVVRELDIRCPEDLSFAGLDSLEFSKFTDPPSTSVHGSGYQLDVRPPASF